MKKHLLALSAAAVLLAPQTVGAEGFSINEWSAEGFAMGGARMFAENDAANMAYNPASLTKIKGEVAKISATYISPHGKYKVDKSGYGSLSSAPSEGHNRVHPAWAPGSYYVRQMNDKEWLGFGAYARFGNSCQYQPGSLPGVNNTSSKVNGMSIGVNYAKKLDSKWSASLGAEVNYAWLQVDKTIPAGIPIPGMEGKMQTEGESYALGWNAAANYAFDDKNEMGIVYRSAVNHSMEANVRAHGYLTSKLGYDPASVAYATGEAYGCVTLPESVMIGYGHKFNDKTRVELNGTWTRWSRFNRFDMTLTGNGSHFEPDVRNWKDGWRYAIGIEHKLSNKYSLLGGVAYDESGIPDYEDTEASMGADFMVPTGTRTTFTIGGQYHDDRQTLAVAIGYMKVGDLSIEGQPGFYDRAKMYDSYTKLFSISYQYNF